MKQEYQGGYDLEFINLKARDLLGQKIYDQIPEDDWRQYDGFIEYLIELHAQSMQQLHRGVINAQDFEQDCREYDARMKNFLRRVTLFVGQSSPNMAEWLGDNQHVSPHYILLDLAQTKMLMSLMVKAFYSYVKNFGDERQSVTSMGNQDYLALPQQN